MNPERWQKIESIFQKALEAGEDRRGAVLEESCEGDESLRRDVESLLEHHQQAGSFINSPAFDSPTATAAAPVRGTLIGALVSHYRVIEEIGAGGMGIVYKAQDNKLGRLVALKFLPEALSGDRIALERFRREARAASALNHPNICTVYEIGEHRGQEFIAMEYLEGQTLAAQIQGRALNSEIISRTAIPIAEALSAAHAKGIVHRDIKPRNIFITGSGLVKVLDFGVAKLIERDAELTATELTATHAIAGTVAYMAPEQLRGEAVDARSDIYSLGIVLYEMATGGRPYKAKAQLELANQILNEQAAPPSGLNPKILPKLEEIILKCLEKDPEERYQTAKEVAVDLRRMVRKNTSAISASTRALTSGMEGNLAPGSRNSALRFPPNPKLLFSAAAILLLLTAYLVYHLAAPEPARVIISQIQPPQDNNIIMDPSAPPQLSPDGRSLVYLAKAPQVRSALWVRQLDSMAAKPLEGTEDAMFPFWAPDGRSIGFFADGKLKKVELSGGAPVELCAASLGRGGSWSTKGDIVFSPNSTSPLYLVPASGGRVVQVTTLDPSRQEANHSVPQFLPDGRHFLYHSESASAQFSGIYIGSREGGKPTLLLRGIYSAVYAPPGHLLFVKDGTIMARGFDADRLELTSDPVTIAQLPPEEPGATLAASRGGLLVYFTYGWGLQMEWFDRTGKSEGTLGERQIYFTPRLSPNDKEVAVAVPPPGSPERDIWIYDLQRGTKRRLTFDQFHNWSPVWSPDGTKIAYSSNLKGEFHTFTRPADGSGSGERLISDTATEYVDSWSSDGRYIAYSRAASGGKPGWDIWAARLSGDTKPFPVVENQFNKETPSFSPDGKWLAYASDESGSKEIYVIPFPHGEGKWQVSVSGGKEPRWRGDGKELFFVTPDNKVMAAEVREKNASLELGSAQVLFHANFSPSAYRTYDVTRDGKRFIIITQPTANGSHSITLITNWPSLIHKK